LILAFAITLLFGPKIASFPLEKTIPALGIHIYILNGKAVSRAAHVRKWKILPIDFSISGGELTPTLKLKRKVTEKKYQQLVDEMYSDPKL
jgi:long-subunit acyl-CoA synthetase (AMP-forming)